LNGRPWRADAVHGVVSALAPHGRDGTGMWTGIAGGSAVVVAALSRHATPEDAADRHPAESRDGSLVLAGDMRLDNRAELAGALGLSDRSSVPDSAFVLAGYERWGHGLLGRLVGEFALAVVDRRNGGVLLARDHVGARPLVIHERRDAIAFASNALALTHFEGVGHALDVRRAAEVLALAYSSERTFVEGVRWLPPATALWVGATTRRWTWWRPDPAQVMLASPEEHERALRETFDQAVGARLRSTGAIGVSMSGGLDSTSTAATAARQLSPTPVQTYTSAPVPGWSGPARPGADADESPLVRALAKLHSNIAAGFVHVTRGECLVSIQDQLWELGAGPIRNPCNLLWVLAILRRARTDGVTTLLTGARGNVCFSADGPDWLAVLLREGRLTAALREVAAWIRSPRAIVSSLLPSGVPRFVRKARGRPNRILVDWIASIPLRPEITADLDLPALIPALAEPRGVAARELALWVAQAGATQADIVAAVAAHTSIEERDPTVDRRVLEVATRQPEWVRRHDGETRAVVRGAMADRLPPEIVRRTRRGEQLPDWLDVMTAARGEIVSEFGQLMGHATSRQLIDTNRLERLIAHWPDRALRGDDTVIRSYRLALLRALATSRYLRWFEHRARTHPQTS
jgi:asparagine synthase (glutamine-hydrolysing)